MRVFVRIGKSGIGSRAWCIQRRGKVGWTTWGGPGRAATDDDDASVDEPPGHDAVVALSNFTPER